MKKVLIIFAFAITLFLCEACGDQPSGKATPVPASAERSPREMGEAIGTLYIKAMEELTIIIKDKPEPEEIKQTVQALKEKYIAQFVEFGKKKAAKTQVERATIDSTLWQQINKLYHVPWYKTYNDAQQHYTSLDPELYGLIRDFNIITQYADFDLLKKQAPDEAKRLGID